MVKVRIAPPDTEEDVSAEQVAAYLLARGWAEQCPNPWRRFARPPWPHVVSVPRAGLFDARAQMEITIRDHARAEPRHHCPELPAARLALARSVVADGPFPHAGDAWFDAWAQSRGAARGAGGSEE